MAVSALMSELQAQLTMLGSELRGRATELHRLKRYVSDDSPLPAPIVKAKVTKAYKMLMPMASAPWASVVVNSVQDRLAVTGVRDRDSAIADACWGVWQDNGMDSEQKLAHNSALIGGRAFATVWPDEDGDPEIILDAADQMIVSYRVGSRRRRTAAMRMWEEGDRVYATLYRPDGIFKFQRQKQLQSASVELPAGVQSDTRWVPREVQDEPWPLENPLGDVPVVELAVNRELVPGQFGYARGEFAHVTGLLDRINLLTFLGLVVAFWMGFPLRAVIGDKILRDDDGNMLAPFEVAADAVAQFEDPNTKLAEFKEANRGNLSIYGELQQLAYLTQTPSTRFPMEGAISHVSGETLLVLEGGQDAKVDGHQGTLSTGHLDILRLGGRLLDKPAELSPRAELIWKDSQARSLAERADAAVKLSGSLPWEAIAEYALNASTDQINRWKAMRAGDAFAQLLDAAQNRNSTGAPELAPAPTA